MIASNQEQKKDFPDSSVGKEFICNAGDPSLIPGSGRPTGEGIGYLLQYTSVSLVAQLVKNLPAMWETWVRSLGWEDPLEKGRATPCNILAWRTPWTVQSMGVAKSWTQLSDFHFHFSGTEERLHKRSQSGKTCLRFDF